MFREVATQHLSSGVLLFDLRCGADAEPSEKQYRRAPALEGVLQEEAADDNGQKQKTAVDERSEESACERQSCGIGFQRALDIPLPVKLFEPLVNFLQMSGE
ncbi:MAG: hypothetical protein JO139_01685 [Alphaproteobacteria bacterium]|nr:hypothetical protein [Alphaproteobacteria bacterium]